jgi:hypothetical protein
MGLHAISFANTFAAGAVTEHAPVKAWDCHGMLCWVLGAHALLVGVDNKVELLDSCDMLLAQPGCGGVVQNVSVAFLFAQQKVITADV